MQILNYLKIKNFLWTKERFIDFQSYNSPLFIIWENAKWKTTIMRATFFALTWEDPFFWGQNLDAIINDHSNTMEVELSIQNRWNEYIINIKKERKKWLDITIQENGNHILDWKLLKDAKLKLSELFWNPTSMLNTYFMFWDTTTDFVNATPTQRLNTIVKISDTFQRYEEISENAKVMAWKLEIDKNKQIWSIEFLDKQIEQLYTNKQEYEKDEDINITEDEINNYKKLLEICNKDKEILQTINQKENEIKDVKNQNIDEINKKLKENKENKIKNESLNTKKNKLLEEKSNLNKEQSEINISLTKLKGELNTKISLKKEKEKNISVINEENNNLFSFEKIDDIILTKEKKISEQKEIETLWNTEASNIKVLEADNERINKEISELNNQLSDTEKLFKENNHCPLCYNELTEKSLDNYKKYLDNDKKTKLDIINKNNIKIENHKKERINLWLKWKNITEEIKKLDIYKLHIESINNNNKIKSEITILDKEIVEIDTKELDNKLLNINNKIKEKEDEISKIILLPVLSDFDENKYNNILELNKNLQFQLDEINKLKLSISDDNKDKTYYDITTMITWININLDRIKDKKDKLKNINEQLIKLNKDKEDAKKIIDELNKDIKEYESLRFFFWKNGVQKQQIRQLLKQIELETNWIVWRFFEDISVKFNYDNKGIALVIQRRVFNNNGWFELKEDTLKNFSDAQQEVLTVLLKLSFSKIVQHLNNTPLNVLFLNETFNTLSKEKESELINTLNIYNTDYHLVFITHNHDLVSSFDEQNILSL